MKNSNQLWELFASVRLAVFTLCTLSLTSIIGTVIPQKEEFPWYVDKYGSAIAQFFQVLDIPDMYNSWWFLGLLGLLCANLIICSIDRFPTAWRLVKADQLAVSPDRLQSMPCREDWTHPAPLAETVETLQASLAKAGWKPASRKVDEGVLLFAGKGAWSRLGVYMVHASILVIFAGAIFGNFLGFKGNVMIPETESTGKIFAAGSSEPIDLGFEVRCDSFAIDYYDNGMPKEYRSVLTVSENGKEVLQEEIEVNNPLTYRGVTFYQSNYQAYQNFIIKFAAGPDQPPQFFKAPYQQEMAWPEGKLRFGIINVEAQGNRLDRIKIWLKAEGQQPSTMWVENGKEATFTSSGITYQLVAKQMYATGLQVAKDPGVWLVYLGCLLMLVGLYVSFFLSHRRIWLLLGPAKKNNGTSIVLAGAAHKNKIGFARSFSRLAEQLHPHRK